MTSGGATHVRIRPVLCVGKVLAGAEAAAQLVLEVVVRAVCHLVKETGNIIRNI